MSTKKIVIESVEEALARGIKIEKLQPIQESEIRKVHTSAKNTADLMTLGEAADFYGEKTKQPKAKKVDLSKVDRKFIPDSLQYIFEEYRK